MEHAHFSSIGSALPTFLLAGLCASVFFSRQTLRMIRIFQRPLAEITHRSWGISWSRIEPGLIQGRACSYLNAPLWDVSFLRFPTSLHSMAPSSGSFCSEILLENLESSGVVSTQAACPDGTGRQYRRLHAEEVIPFISLSFRTSTCAFCVFCSLFPS